MSSDSNHFGHDIKTNDNSNSEESSEEESPCALDKLKNNEAKNTHNNDKASSHSASSSPDISKDSLLKKDSHSDAGDNSKKGRSDGKKHRSRSPRKRSRRSGSRHRRDRSHRSRSGSRHRRRRNSESKDRKRRSRSRSRDRRRSPKRSRRDSTKEGGSRSSDKDKSNRSESSHRAQDKTKRSGSRGRDKHRSRSRSRDRTRARDSRRRSRSRGHRHSSRSRSRDRRRSGRSRSKDRRRRSKSRSRDRRRRRSRSLSNRRLSRSASTSPYRFGFNKAMDAQERLARRLERAKELTKIKKEEEQKKANGFLGLKDDKLKEAIEKAAQMIAGSGPVLSSPHEYMSAQASAQMSALRKQAEAETGVSVPTYYNPMVVNPMMFAQQQAKRNKLWAKKDNDVDPTSSKDQVWSKTSLGDEKSDEKFAKLMGIKQLDAAKNEEEVKKRQELFSHLDMQYEQARVVTHTQRGAGLGFASNNPNTLLAQQANQQLNTTSTLPPKT